MTSNPIATAVWLFGSLLIIFAQRSSGFLLESHKCKVSLPGSAQSQSNSFRCCRLDIRRVKTSKFRKTFHLKNSNNEDDDDGWGTNTDIGIDSSNNNKVAELNQLREERLQRSNPSNPAYNSNNRNAGTREEERDLFIPIFAIVSLIGLFGSYGYEMLRLYSRGELYLPWNQ